MAVHHPRNIILAAFLLASGLCAQPCLVSYTFTSSPLPVNGTYGCGENVTFCYTVTNWNSTSANWFHGIGISLGPGWDVSTLVPGPPPATIGGSGGTWGWYNSVTGTAGSAIGAQGPGYFFDLNNDGNPGNNFGDFATGAVNWQFCWTVSVLSGAACLNGLDMSVGVNSFGDSETGSWNSSACHGDDEATNPPSVIQACSVNAGIGASATYCSSAAPVDLFALLGGSPDLGGLWTGPSGTAVSSILDPANGTSGMYTYTVSDMVAGCSGQASVDITLNDQPVAGVDAAVALCTSDAVLSLLPLLGPTAEPGGTWTAPDGSPFVGTFTPAADVAGAYTYQLSGTAPCISAQATVSVSLNPSPNAGADGTLSICTTSAPTALFNSLNGTPNAGGTWTAPDGSTLSGTYDPIVNVPGTYTYTVVGTAPCPNGVATIQVSENAPPNAGSDAIATLCETASPVPLGSLLGGTPDANGSWTDPSGAAIPGTLDPALASPGNYTYMVNGVAPCPNDQAVLTVVVNSQPSAGIDGVLALCEGSPTTDMFIQLGGSPEVGGTWTDATGTMTGALFDPDTQLPGVYTYTVGALAPCVASTATVDVSVSSQPNAGNDAVYLACSNDPEVDLFPLLGFSVTVGGAWTGPNGMGFNGSFAPNISADGDYTYTVLGTAPCTTESAVVTVSTTVAAEPGLDGVLSVCDSGSAVDLFNSLNGTPSAGGNWTDPLGAPSNGQLDPAIAIDGEYVYTIIANGPCPAASSLVNVSIEGAPDPGVSALLDVCDSAPEQQLFDVLGGTPSNMGSWTDPSGAVHGPLFDPSVDPSGVYTYTVPATAPCTSLSSTITVNSVPAVSAGTGGEFAVCANAYPLDLFNELTGSPSAGGSWVGPDGSPVVSVDPAVALSGNYTYIVAGVAPCPNDQSVVVLTIDPMPMAGSDSAIDLCMDADPIDLFDLLGGSPWTTGSWTGPSGSSTGIFMPALNVPGDHVYTVPGAGACEQESAEATVSVSVNPLPDPQIVADPRVGCIPLEVAFSTTGVIDIQSATWQFGDGGTATSTGNSNHTYAEPGEFSVRLVVVDAHGCSGSVVVNDLIHASNGPSAFFYATPERVSTEDPTVFIVHPNEPMTSIAWTIDGADIEGEGNFSWSFTPRVDIHEICLTATDTLGCFNSYCQLVEVDDVLTAFVPNAFTPDGDGRNDIFLPSVVGLDPDSYTFSVFDRWGNRIFHTTDPAEGWNGAIGNNGAIQQQEVYVWRIVAHDQFTADRKELFGTATLVK